ncbi:hypothetical protein HK104_000233, partial [Borealophlyctis nickersoniae]
MLGQTPVDTPSTDGQTAKAEISTLPAAATATVPPADSSAPAAAVPSHNVRTDPATMIGTDLQLRQKTSSSDHLDGFSLLGVRLSYFDTFIDE